MMATDDILTAQEKRILQLIADGKAHKDIALCLHLKASSVTVYVDRIRDKMDVPNTYNAIATAIRQGIID